MREHGSILAAAEKRALVWMAARLPRRINADHLTALGLLAMVGVGASYWASRWHELALLGAVAGLALNWLGDSLDGTVARLRDHQRPRYGFYVDHVVDVTSMLLLCAGLALSPHMSPVVALLLLAAYLMVSAETYLATHACGVFRVSLLKVGPTELPSCWRQARCGCWPRAPRWICSAAPGCCSTSAASWRPSGCSVRCCSALFATGWRCTAPSRSRADRWLQHLARLPLADPRRHRSTRLPETVRRLRRWLAFNAVGTMGVAVQLAVLLSLSLTEALGLNYLVATVLAVESAILHNFVWHEHWT